MFMESNKLVITKIRSYIIEATLSDKKDIKDDTLIFDVGLLDSMGLLFLIEFLKEEYDVEVNDEELNPENFKSINSIVLYVEEKLKANRVFKI